MHTKSKLQKTLTRLFKFKFRPSFDFITVTQTLPFLKEIRDPESICVYLKVLVWHASDICLYPLSEKSHQRLSLPPNQSQETSENVCASWKFSWSLEAKVSISRRENSWEPQSREKLPGRRTHQGAVTSIVKGATCLQDAALDNFPNPDKRDRYRANSGSVSLTLHSHPYSKQPKNLAV